MDITALDFAALSAEEKRELIYALNEALDETAQGLSFQQKILAQTLFVARSYHFYEQLFEKCSISIPALYRDVMEHIWRWLLGDVEKNELAAFYQEIDSVLTYLMTSDDEFFNEAAWEKYSGEWNAVCCGIGLTGALAAEHILAQIVFNKVNWYELSDNQLMTSIGEYISDCSLEPMFKSETGGYKYEELKRHDTDVYASSTFVRIFSLLQEDFRLAKTSEQITRDDVLRLREQYQNKDLFNPQEIIKIADWLKCLFT